ncbi:MAG: GAF domain-containing protein [Chloroflexi bacterium]|nr:GAF domain-containing protein [Chloroflexota bacterium]
MRRIVSNIRIPLYILNGGNLLAASLLLAFQYLPDLANNRVEAFMTLVLMSTALLGILLAYRGRTQEAALIFMGTVTIIASVLGFLYGGLENPAVTAMYFILIPFGGLYLERRFHYITIGLVVLLMFWMYLGGLQGFGGLTPISVDEFTVSLTALLIIGAVLDFTSTRYRVSLAEVEANRSALETRNLELSEIRAGLEQSVAERTHDLDRRNRYLVAISEIVRESSALLEELDILQRSVDLIAERFGFYHVGVFMVDATGEWAVLRAVSSEGGRKMLERGHRLQVGKQGIVGYVTGIGLPRVSQDISLDRIHALAAELPDTRSEMALPLKARDEIIGVLDIQDAQAQAFSQQDVAILQTLADQLALAISNARLYRQSRESLEEVQRAYGEINRRAWLEAQREGRLPTYHFVGGTRQRADRISTGGLPRLEGGNTVEIPIRVRGQAIGAIEIARPDSAEWTQQEQVMLEAISEQLGIALDGARLYDATQQRAANERLISELTVEIRESLDMETILRTAASRLREVLDLPEVTIRLTERTSQPDGNGGNGRSGQMD